MRSAEDRFPAKANFPEAPDAGMATRTGRMAATMPRAAPVSLGMEFPWGNKS